MLHLFRLNEWEKESNKVLFFLFVFRTCVTSKWSPFNGHVMLYKWSRRRRRRNAVNRWFQLHIDAMCRFYNAIRSPKMVRTMMHWCRRRRNAVRFSLATDHFINGVTDAATNRLNTPLTHRNCRQRESKSMMHRGWTSELGQGQTSVFGHCSWEFR